MNTKYGQILRSLKVCKFDQLPEYDENLIPTLKQYLKKVNKQIAQINKNNTLYKQKQQQIGFKPIAEQTNNQNFSQGKLSILIDEVYRIKRFLLIMNDTRLRRIENNFWHYGGNVKIPNENLSPEEREYINQYKNLTTDYMEEMGLDLTIDLDPPMDVSVEVRFLNDCGEILNDEGKVLKLDKNSVFYIKKRLIEGFIKDGSAVVMGGH